VTERGYGFWRRLAAVHTPARRAPAATPADDELRRHLALGDHLRSHPQDAHAYAAVKREGDRRFPGDRDAYQEFKGPMVREVL
jgi:GrpB-like predicted nucleotidyltransferase (UPF0157 family)